MSDLTWLHNAPLERIQHWLDRGELSAYVYRKGYMALFYDVSRVYVSAPQPGALTAAELLRRGIVGLYGRRCTGA